MAARYVHVEVREMRGRVGERTAEADCLIALPTGEKTTVTARLHSDRAPYWRVVSVEDFGNPLVERAVEIVGEEELFARIATAAALWNVWDSLRAGDAEL